MPHRNTMVRIKISKINIDDFTRFYVVNRGSTFRRSFTECSSIVSRTDCPILALTATSTESELKKLEQSLGVYKFEQVVTIPNRYYISVHKLI